MKTKKITIILLAALMFGIQVSMASSLPEDVNDVTATALSSDSIGLAWSAAKDGDGSAVDYYHIYYGTHSVFDAENKGEYENDFKTKDSSTTYILGGLKADTSYYFSVTAINSNGDESEHYSIETIAKTLVADDSVEAPAEDNSGEAPAEEVVDENADVTSPTVSSVKANNKKEVVVEFNEEVQLATENPEGSFTISEQLNNSNLLNIVSANLDPSNKKLVILKTEEQKPDVSYILTVGVNVKDLAGNPIISGSTDSALFTGSDKEVPSEEEKMQEDIANLMNEDSKDTTEEDVAKDTTEEDVTDCNEDMMCFVQKLQDCSKAKVINLDETHKYNMEISGTDGNSCLVKFEAENHPSILYAGSSMDCKIEKNNYETIKAYKEALKLENCTGDLVQGYEEISIKDTTPPEDITNFISSFKKDVEKYTILLSWTPSLNTAKDLVDQILYTSNNHGNDYDSGKSLGSEVSKTSIKNLEGGKEYTFKITTKDDSGNESTGVIKSIRLPQTGVGIGILALLSTIGANKVLRRKKDKDLF